MKKYVILLPILLTCVTCIYGQSVKFNDLVYYTGLTNRQVFDNLMQTNVFKQDFSETVNGQEIEHFKNVGAKPNTEIITVGKYYKLNDGTVLRTLDYVSTEPQNIINMISQAKRYGLDLKFRGGDNTNNIYLYDNNFYQVNIYLKRDQSSGLVEIKQKEYLGIE